jgi:hypothetical protein
VEKCTVVIFKKILPLKKHKIAPTTGTLNKKFDE